MNPELIQALKKQDKDKIRTLINLPSEGGFPPLMELLFSEKNSDLNTLCMLLENGADVNARSSNGSLWINYLIQEKKVPLDALKLILEKGNLNPFLATKNTAFTPQTEAWFDKLDDHVILLKKYELEYRERQSKLDPDGLKRDLDHLTLINFIKQKGHSLGMDGEIKINSPGVPGGSELITMQSYLTPFTIEHLVNLLGLFDARLSREKDQSTKALNFKTISDAFKDLSKTLNKDEKLDFLVDRIKNHASLPTILSVNAKDHALSVAIFGDYVIVSNRGGVDERRHGFGTRIFILTEETRKILTPEYIESLSDSSKTEDIINARLKQLIPRENFLEEIESQEQKHGTCSFVNHKSIIRPILYLMERKRLALERNLPENDKSIAALAAVYAKQAYKNFTYWMRDREVNDMLQQYKNGGIPKDVFEQMTIAYIEQHVNTWKDSKDPIKRAREIGRAYFLLKDLPEDFIKKILGALEDNGNAFLRRAEGLKLQFIVDFLRKNKPESQIFLEAVQMRDSEKILAMLSNGLDPNQICKGNTSTLFIEALEYDLPKPVIDAMIAKGASVNIKLKDGFSPLCLECNKYALADLSSVKKLVELGADIDYVVPKSGLSPLFYAIKNEHIEIVAYLLKHGADKKTINKGQTALTFAVSHEPQNVELLLENGADPNETNADHETPLIVFVKNFDFADTVDLLIKHGARVGMKDKDGKTALDIVKARSHTASGQAADFTEVIALLEAAEKNEKERETDVQDEKNKLKP